MAYCASCGTLQEPDGKFCRSCGVKQPDSDPVPKTATTAPASPALTPTATPSPSARTAPHGFVVLTVVLGVWGIAQFLGSFLASLSDGLDWSAAFGVIPSLDTGDSSAVYFFGFLIGAASSVMIAVAAVGILFASRRLGSSQAPVWPFVVGLVAVILWLVSTLVFIFGVGHEIAGFVLPVIYEWSFWYLVAQVSSIMLVVWTVDCIVWLARYRPVRPAPSGAGTAGTETNPLAIVGFVLSLFIPIAGLVTGYVSLSQIKRTGQAGRGLALAAVVIGWVSTALGILWIVLVLVAANQSTY